jgi:hypothetical protein
VGPSLLAVAALLPDAARAVVLRRQWTAAAQQLLLSAPTHAELGVTHPPPPTCVALDCELCAIAVCRNFLSESIPSERVLGGMLGVRLAREVARAEAAAALARAAAAAAPAAPAQLAIVRAVADAAAADAAAAPLALAAAAAVPPAGAAPAALAATLAAALAATGNDASLLVSEWPSQAAFARSAVAAACVALQRAGVRCVNVNVAPQAVAGAAAGAAGGAAGGGPQSLETQLAAALAAVDPRNANGVTAAAVFVILSGVPAAAAQFGLFGQDMALAPPPALAAAFLPIPAPVYTVVGMLAKAIENSVVVYSLLPARAAAAAGAAGGGGAHWQPSDSAAVYDYSPAASVAPYVGPVRAINAAFQRPLGGQRVVALALALKQ